MAESKLKTLNEIIKDINKGKQDPVAYYGITDREIPRIPFSSPKANKLCRGGVPKYRITEFSGKEQSGKSTTALDVIANYQKEPDAKKVVYFDCENGFDPFWASIWGVDVDKMLLVQPDGDQSAEKLYQTCIDMIKTNEVGLVIFDSVVAPLPDSINDEDMAKKIMGGNAQALARFADKVSQILYRYRCTLIGINQVRDNMDSLYQDVKIPGGKGWGHFCSLRLVFKKGYPIKKDNTLSETMNCESPIGEEIKISPTKNRISKFDRRLTSYTFTYTNGVRVFEDTIDCALEFDLVQKSGSWISIIDLETGEVLDKVQGVNKLIEYCEEHKDYFNTLKDKVNELVTAK